MKQQKRPLHYLTFLIFVFGLAGCSSGSVIRSDYDRSADFSSYKTWNFIKDAGPDYAGYESMFSRHMLTAITIEMDKRGYVKSDNPDLFVNFNANLRYQTKVTTTPTAMPMGGYYGYRGGYYGGWRGYSYATETHVSQYTEGTFNIDLVDAGRMQLVWEAVGTGRITAKVRKNLEKVVREGVPKYFANYPFVAGSSVRATN